MSSKNVIFDPSTLDEETNKKFYRIYGMAFDMEYEELTIIILHLNYILEMKKERIICLNYLFIIL
jgi:hypothetical protein